jgi:hypothetical protein
MARLRVVVVVPRHERGLHEYLQRSLGCLKDVEVVLDRRAAAATPSDERRRQHADASRILMCALVRCPVPEPGAGPETPPAPPPDGTHRTLLWPLLRLENL